MKPHHLIERAKRDAHRTLQLHDPDYRFECACCGVETVYTRYSWIELRERLDRIQGARSLVDHAIDAMAYGLAQQIDEDVVRSFQK